MNPIFRNLFRRSKERMEQIVPEAAEQAVKEEVEQPTTKGRGMKGIPLDRLKVGGVRLPGFGTSFGFGGEDAGYGGALDLNRLFNWLEAGAREKGIFGIGGRQQVLGGLSGAAEVIRGAAGHMPSLGELATPTLETFVPDVKQIGPLTRREPIDYEPTPPKPSISERFKIGQEQFYEQDPVASTQREATRLFEMQFPNPTAAQQSRHEEELARIANELPFEQGFGHGMMNIITGEMTNPAAIATGKVLWGPAGKAGIKGLGYGLKGLSKVGWEGYKFLPNLLSRAAIKNKPLFQ